MNIDNYKRLDITLHQDESDTLREILRLAYERLRSSPAQVMRGVPVERRAGLVGPELFRVKEMLEQLGKATGINLPAEMAASNDSEDSIHVMTGVFKVGSLKELADAIQQIIAIASRDKGAQP